MNKRNVFILGILFFLGQNTEAQILEKGTIMFKAVHFISEDGIKEASLLMDTMILKVAQILDKNKVDVEKKATLKNEMIKQKEEMISSFSKEMPVDAEANYTYAIKFSPTEVIREKFDLKNKKLRHQQIYPDGRIVNYDFWTNKSKLTYLKEDNLHVLPQTMTVSIDKNDKKNILNHSCYKVRVEEELPVDEDEDIEFLSPHEDISEETLSEILKTLNSFMKAKIIYEMYVTEDIKLFPHAVLDLTNPLQGYFPLEVVEYINKLPSIRKKTTTVSIQ